MASTNTIILILYTLKLIICNSSNCHCDSYYGQEDNFNADGTCKYCSSCTNNSCECKSQSECSTTYTIVGCIFAAIIILCCISFAIRRRRRRWRRRALYGIQPAPVIVQQSQYIPPSTQTQQPIITNPQMVNGQPVIYVQPQQQQPQYIATTAIQPQPLQQPMIIQQQQPQPAPIYSNITPQPQPQAPPSYDTVIVPSAPPQSL